MKLSENLRARGFVNQTTFENLEDLDKEPRKFYWGVDPSADSMTVGNFAMAMMARHFIDAGYEAYLLVGGATGMIGDPDGKKTERNLLSLDDITRNKNAIAEQYRRVFAGKDFKIVDNYDWFKDMNYLEFLREIGKNVPMSQMLGREFVQSRLGQDGEGISYAEFSYSLIQGYDFLFQFREYGVTLQLAGADQWGNSVTGVDLIRRLEGAEAHVYTGPLIINKTTGQKFGKSEDGAVWLDEKKTSVYKFYQFWLNSGDADVIDYMKVYTLLPIEKIAELVEEVETNPAGRVAQKTLAFEVTKIVHGQERAQNVEKVSQVLFGDEDFLSLSEQEVSDLAAEIPTVTLGKTVIEALVETGVANSNSEARRLIESGAISINSSKIDADQTIDSQSLIKKGKNSFVLVR